MVTVNDWLRQTMLDLYGDEQIVDAPMGMAGEDFAYMANLVPGAMFSLRGENRRGRWVTIRRSLISMKNVLADRFGRVGGNGSPVSSLANTNKPSP